MAKRFPISLIVDVIGNAGEALDATGKKLKGMKTRAMDVGKSLTKNVTVPLVGIGAAAVKVTADFEQGMSDVSTLIDTNTESLEDMGKTVLEIGARTPVAVNDLTSALFDVRSAGISADDQFKVLEKSAQLGVAGLGSTAQAADLVTSAINSFGLEGEAANQIYDQIFKTTKNGKTTIAELAPAFGDVAKTIAATGTPVDEYLAAVAALTTTGASASTSQRQLQQVVAGLTRDTKETSAVFEKLGAEDFDDLIAKSGGMVNALRRISDQAGGNKTELLKLVGSTEALGAIIGLTDTVADKFDTSLANMRDGSSEVDKAFGKQNTTLKSSAQVLKNQLVASGVEVGKVLAPVLKDVADILKTVTTAFMNLSPETKRFIVIAGGVAAALGPAIIVAVKLAPAIMAVGKALKFLKVIIAANPIGALVVLMTTAVVMITEEWEHFEAFFKLLWDGVVSAFEWAWSKIEPIVDAVSDAVSTVVEGAGDLLDFVGLGGPDIPAATFDAATVNPNDPQQIAALNRVLGLGGFSVAGTPGANGQTNIAVTFANAPRGMRTAVESSGDANVEVGTGVNMGAM